MRGVLGFMLAIVAAVQLGSELSTSAAETENSKCELDERATLSAYRGMVEEHLAGVERALRIVALSNEARSGRMEEYRPLLQRLSSDLPTDATVWFVLPDGSYFATEIGGMTEENLRDRKYFPALMRGEEVKGELVISKSTGHRSVVFAAPVVVEGKVIGGVGVSLRVRLLSALVDKNLRLPDDRYFYALERDTRIVLHRKAERMFKTPSDVGDEALGEEFRRVLRRDSGNFDYVLNGKKITSIFERSPTLGWYFFIAQEAP